MPFKCVHLLDFYVNLYISFIYEDNFNKFTENVYGCKSMSVNSFVIFKKNNMATIAGCSKIIILLRYNSLPCGT